ncbi:transcriptional regulator [Shouchella clausii]|nr:transcriptional regulator [Shouchella clausii]PAE84942.1 transcriptional regulator [Shouchella clausii]PAE86144.1 transcriptional regulator [Shouchella clausii]PAF06826.1 transcriptional regulator [Shouchella clausii]
MRSWLKNIRSSKGLTQLEVAEKVRIERSYYTMIENGDRKPSVEVAQRIAKVLDFEWTIFFENKCNETLLKI